MSLRISVTQIEEMARYLHLYFKQQENVET